MHAFRSYIFAARIACDSGPTCFIKDVVADEQAKWAFESILEAVVISRGNAWERRSNC